MTDYRAGQSATFTAEYFNEFGAGGTLVDPSGDVSVTITYGTGGDVVAGPFTYSGGQITRQSAGIYAFDWLIPYSAATGVYVMNWVFTDGPFATQIPAVENIYIIGGAVTPPANPDTGFWTGVLANNGVSIPLGGVDANGVGWALLKVDGWDGAPTVGQVVQRGGDHGGIASPQWFGPRTPALTVFASCPSQAARDTARAMMQQAVDVNSLGVFQYDEPVPKWAAVRRSGVLRESYPTLTDVQFSVLLVAPDPRKYGTQTKTVVASATGVRLGVAAPLTAPISLPAQPPLGAATVVNAGNFETRPTVKITGPITGPALYCQTTGQTVSFSSLSLGASDVLVVDFAQKLGYLNGAFRSADLASSWWTLAPGTTQIVLQGAAGAGSQMTITYQDAWM